MKSLESPNYCGFSPRDLDCYTILEIFEKNSIVYHKPSMKGLFRYINSSFAQKEFNNFPRYIILINAGFD